MTDFVHKFGVAEGHCHHRCTAHDTRRPSGHSGRLAARMKKKKKSNTCDGYHGLRQSALDEMVMLLFLSVLKFFQICRFLWHHILISKVSWNALQLVRYANLLPQNTLILSWDSDPFVRVPIIGVKLWSQRALIVPHCTLPQVPPRASQPS
jgi:hypothetical protein